MEDVCVPPDENGIYYKDLPMPNVIHFCQTFRAGEVSFMKRRVPHDLFTCESPMLIDVPKNLAASDYRIKDNKKESVNNARSMKRHAFTLCVIYNSINSALLDFKQKMCINNPNTNYNRTINVGML